MVPVPCGDTNTEMNLGDASDKTMLEVWFKLNDNDVDAVDLPKGTNVRKFRDEVKEKRTVSLQHCDAAMLDVFAPGADPKSEDTLDPGDPVPGGTSSKNPLIVVAPKPHLQQQVGELSCCSRIPFLHFFILFIESVREFVLTNSFTVLPVQGRPPLSPSPARQQQIPPPSQGKNLPKLPETNTMKTPSSEEGQAKALTYVASNPSGGHPLYCSANTIALQVTALLQAARREKNNLDTTYFDAARLILNARPVVARGLLKDEEVDRNERFYTGAFCDALNAVLAGGISVLHQGCIGNGPTHSDLSARYCLDGYRSATLMVGEGKRDDDPCVRMKTRGQIFNELIRHRKIDRKLNGDKEQNFRPILLLAFNLSYVSLELAFPSTKGGHMEKSEWVTFANDLPEETETFWTIPVAMVHIAFDHGMLKLPYVLCFIADTLKFLQSLGTVPRVQFKTPWVTKSTSELIDGKKCGDNVTIIESKSGKRVYKEFCYYLRERDIFNQTETIIQKADQRWPPNRKLLDALGEPYSSWKIEDGPCGIKILVYDYIEGTSWPTSRLAWIQVLKQVEKIHSQGYVHGDLLPRNLIFNDDAGYVIDFDLMRKEGGLYVAGYNHSAFGAYRHKDAHAGNKMQKEHDLCALMQMSKKYFAHHDGIDNVSDISGLVQYFEESECEVSKGEQARHDEATGSPVRASTRDIPVDQLRNMQV